MRSFITPTFRRLAYLLLSSLLLQGCATALIAGAATGITLASDRRSAGTIIDDQTTETRAAIALRNDQDLAQGTHISVTSFNHVVLLTGQVQNQHQRTRATTRLRGIQGVKLIHNEIRLGTATTIKTRSHDAWLTTKVKSALIHHKHINALQIKVVTANSTVYLMGLVSRSEGHIAATTTQLVNGVEGVIKVFEYTD